MEIKFNVFWKKNLGTLYKDNSVDILGKEVSIDLDLSQVNSIYANFKVGGKSFTDLVEIVDVEANLIKIPFKTDVIKAGINELELVASMKNGSVMPSQTYAYSVEKSLEDRESIEAETNYPILVKLLQDVDIKVKEVNESSARVNDLVSRVEASVDELESFSNEVSDLRNMVEASTDKVSSLESVVINHEDRISTNEKNIKTHDILIDVLYNEALDDVINLTEEGNIVSLTKSRDGIVEIKELQGNTMINYCTNGSKEFALNGYIDAEGTDVKLSNTVDNGLVDVICEGNTLILDSEGNEVRAGAEGARLVSVGEGENGYCIELLSTNSDGTLSNKKIIPLSEPLRRLTDKTKDEFTKVGDKWYVVRNTYCEDLVVTKGSSWKSSVAAGMVGFHDIMSLNDNYIASSSSVEIAENILCDKLISIGRNQLSSTTENAIVRGRNYIGVTVKADKLETQDLAGFKKYVNSLNAKIIYNLAEPIYEEITDPTVVTYLDSTYISSDSVVPCNMKIRNTGYNTTIKPDTQYTVVFDTDKNGEVGIELSGEKVTTSNNIATITTPATLSDSDLRLYCKGIKSSKVRLLEGNKSSCVPGYFEGLQSCFEDKLQDDGTYKIEITSRNKDITKQSNIQLSSIGPLRGVGNVKDRFIFRDDKLVIERRLGERDYQNGDEYLNNALTDKIKTVCVLDKPYYEEVPSKLQKLILKCYEDGSLFFDTSVPPTSTVAYSVDMPLINKLNSLGDMSTNLVSTTWDMDYRLFELEWMLYERMAVSVSLEEMFNIRRSGTMALSRFEQAKIMILGGAYSDATLRKQLGTYLSRGIITQEEYDELMSMMDARLLVEGN